MSVQDPARAGGTAPAAAPTHSAWIPRRAHPLSWWMLVITTLSILTVSIDAQILPTVLPGILDEYHLSALRRTASGRFRVEDEPVRIEFPGRRGHRDERDVREVHVLAATGIARQEHALDRLAVVRALERIEARKFAEVVFAAA